MGLYDLKIIRRLIGGTWYKQTSTGELPGLYGGWWTKYPLKPHRYHYTEKIQVFKSGKLITNIKYDYFTKTPF